MKNKKIRASKSMHKSGLHYSVMKFIGTSNFAANKNFSYITIHVLSMGAWTKKGTTYITNVITL